MEIKQEQVLAALGKVTDPNTGKDLVSMNMVEDLRIEGRQVNFTVVLPTLSADYKSDLTFACMAAVQEVYADAEVNIHLMARAQTAQEGEQALPHVKNIIAVASGKGGVGKSTISTNLALGLKALGARVGLIDADLYGPSIPTMLGLNGQRPQIREVYGKPKIVPLQAYGLPVISMGFIIEPEQAVVLRGPRLAGIIKQFFHDVLWEPLDYLVVDLPPGTGDVQLTLVQTVPVTGAIIVTTPQEVAIADAVKAMNMFRLPSVDVPILGVVENMSWFTPPELPDKKYYLFGQGGGRKMADMSGSTLLGQIPIVEQIREGGDSGKPSVLGDEPLTKNAFLEIARNTFKQVAERNEKLAPTKMVHTS
ncbi:MAG: Mrp/NBP35 family ATP-binding protein [Saprospiraceae bacterium]|nr:Mrp/NBP35 family ATP-binding protein [Saprospiraceae bacterium]MCB0677971.1 Mrp/NBP35 family ATP-binding protein [Saprospiraceae bacterium]